ncbi:hypothetical protein [Methylobrevis pamukkalensis]|uniref:Uncharacterized protein n=1 Tax=Methylobrevis pamukkalensis TaxID=1439726 RepID=A0A1E3H3P3_9HYPH|nr:hypothetical protein [Methylobrevis pamukkalensis]ODN70932.1 hypothetical protein A6302_01704 [Methylobrevis pamukkalensis]
MSSSCLTGSRKIIATGLAITSMIVVGLANLEMSSDSAGAGSTVAATKADASLATVSSGEAYGHADTAEEASAAPFQGPQNIRVILALK